MNEILTKAKLYLDLQVANHSIYVWGASGQSAITEAWIRQKEARSNSGKYADTAIAFWRKQVKAGFGTLLKAYDCSGLISKALMYAGVLDKRYDCDGLYSRCTKIDTLRDGALLFRVSSNNPNDETHVGMYFGGYAYHAKGRACGVVREPYKASYWHKIAWLKAIPMDAADTATDGTVAEPTRDLSLQSPMLRGEDVMMLQGILLYLGYDIGQTRADGVYGAKTDAAVRLFKQRASVLKADGIADADMRSMLGMEV